MNNFVVFVFLRCFIMNSVFFLVFKWFLNFSDKVKTQNPIKMLRFHKKRLQNLVKLSVSKPIDCCNSSTVPCSINVSGIPNALILVL